MKPLVSVLTTCYNQRCLLPKAIEGTLRQKTTFPFDLIIIDDGSTDGSADIVRNYGSLDNRIKSIAKPHTGLIDNYMTGFAQCRGEYVALCDADDYWTDPLKLQKQVDYMESHPLCGAVFTRAIINENGVDSLSTLPPKYLDFDMMLRGGHMFSPTQMIRMDCLKYFWRDYKRKGFFIWDYPMYLYLTRYFEIGYLDDVTAVYRKQIGSFTNTHSRRRRLTLILGMLRIKIYYILKYGCKLSTIGYLVYRFARDIYSVIFKRWYK